jgi:hypothetical protein
MTGVVNAAEAGGLQAALDTLPAGGGTVLVPAGTWRVSSPVEKRLVEGQHLFLVGEGRATVLVNENREGQDLLRIVGAVGTWWPDLKITIRDITFVGNHESGNALVVEYPNDTMIDGCFFYGHGGIAVYLKTQGTNVTCRDCWMRDCKRTLRAENIHHLTFHGNQTRSMERLRRRQCPSGRSRRDAAPGVAPRPDKVETELTIYKDGGQVQAEHVFLDRNCREVRLVNNHLAYGQNEAIILDGTAQHVIVGNTIEGFKVGILARNDKERDCRDITIGSNYIHYGCAVRLEGQCNGFVISDNIITDAQDGAVVIARAGGAGAHAISGNVIRKSVYKGQGGVALGDSRGCNVTGNVFEEVTAGPAISAGPGGGGHVIAGNNVVRSAGEGIVVRDAPGCMVAGNLVDGEEKGKT